MARGQKVLWGTAMLFAVLSFAPFSPVRAADDNAVKAGDYTGIQYTCRLGNGKVASSSIPSVAEDSGIAKSPVFVPRTTEEPVSVRAGEAAEKPKDDRLVTLEDAIAVQLAKSIPGMHPGDSRTVEIETELQAALNSKDKVVRLARIRQRPKELRLTKEEYVRRAGKDPAVEDAFSIDPDFPGKVVSVEDGEVRIRFSAPSASEMETPFGKATVRETEKYYEAAIDAVEGTLVRTNGVIGRITQVDDRMFTVDYGHTSGWEKLTCDVTVAVVQSSHAENKE